MSTAMSGTPPVSDACGWQDLAPLEYGNGLCSESINRSFLLSDDFSLSPFPYGPLSPPPPPPPLILARDELTCLLYNTKFLDRWCVSIRVHSPPDLRFSLHVCHWPFRSTPNAMLVLGDIATLFFSNIWWPTDWVKKSLWGGCHQHLLTHLQLSTWYSILLPSLAMIFM